ncbi:MAG: butyrate kinase, partial [Candidatus Hydrogenedentes bacterium]|nr:butyrate kinase [Candidatus Hydrogenedentota bacterium]
GLLLDAVKETLNGWNAGALDAIAARGGALPRPPGKLSGGTYLIAERRDGNIHIEQDIVTGVLDCPEKDHACNLGIPVAAALAREWGIPAYTTDPVILDEFAPEAELSGYAAIVRRSRSHALSVRAAARRAADIVGRPMEDLNLVVAHLGGGITVAAVRKGKMIDNNMGLLGSGPFSPQRAGQLPIEELIDLCYSGQFTHDALIVELAKRGGLQSYLGEHRMEVIEERVHGGDEHAKRVVDAMVYQIVKEIGAMYAALDCDVEAIVLTGGLTKSKLVRNALRRRVERLAPVMVFEGSLDMAALAAGTVDVLAGRIEPQRYQLPQKISKSERMEP